ncbi:cation transport protein [Gleimia coleocanis DSM 15436]|uniref:Cation transport protein n=1 Tax=Gleimia coleocanis DSM 15436 TaxID=525245 RepID=C0W0R1_9ACTO|nr:potassium transporter TrkG [Gleimia coleocanis]EEH63635.1 cation transport protein [Gleimia coleocanis DSM 15436]
MKLNLPFQRSQTAVFRPDTLPPLRSTDPTVSATHRPRTDNSLIAKIRQRADYFARTYPARVAVVIFAMIIAIISALLSLPIATQSGQRAPFVDVLFTATSAVCVTGLVTVDTASYWSVFGQVVIAIGISIGGLGVMTLASALGLAVSHHLGLTQRLLAASETKTSSLGQIGSLLKAVVVTALTADFILFLVLLPRFLTLENDFSHSVWYALFMAIAIFNNAGFIVMPEGLTPFVSDPWMITPIILGTFMGAIGFPVMQDLSKNWRTPTRLTLHTKLTVVTYFALYVINVILVAASEWQNKRTYGQLSVFDRVMHSLLAGANSRTSGISIIDMGEMTRGTWFIQDIFMFIGGGSASTAGGMKVTTFAILALAVLAEARGDRDIEVFGRRIPPSTVRVAVAVTLIGAFIVSTATFILLLITPFSLDQVLVETISAFGTVGLSTGITPLLPDGGKYLLTLLMFLGRVGTMTFAAALALRSRRRVIRLPKESPIVG